MSFDDILDTKPKKRQIRDPKLKRLMNRRKVAVKAAPSEPPQLTVMKVLTHKPHETVRMVIDGKERKPPQERITIYKCEKCGKQFNHTQYQEAMGILPACPTCDK